MQFLQEVIKDNPNYVIWFFTLVNACWLVFTFFGKQRHDTKLKELEHELKFNADRRLKIFELKASHYSGYVVGLDEFGRKNQVDIPEKMQPIFNTYMKEYLDASDSGDKERQNAVITWFGDQISILMRDGLNDLLKLKSESNKLKLIATEDMLNTLAELETLTQRSMDLVNQYLSDFTKMTISNDHQATIEYVTKMKVVGQSIRNASDLLLLQMRSELNGLEA